MASVRSKSFSTFLESQVPPLHPEPVWFLSLFSETELVLPELMSLFHEQQLLPYLHACIPSSVTS